MRLFWDIAWSIPIPLKDYLFIASGDAVWRRGGIKANSTVKNHIFFAVFHYL